jgi:flagellin
MATMGAQAKALEVQNTFLTKLRDAVEQGISNLVDADLAKESARLQSLQVKQQLGAQALSIANQAPQLILALFRQA